MLQLSKQGSSARKGKNQDSPDSHFEDGEAFNSDMLYGSEYDSELLDADVDTDSICHSLMFESNAFDNRNVNQELENKKRF